MEEVQRRVQVQRKSKTERPVQKTGENKQRQAHHATHWTF